MSSPPRDSAGHILPHNPHPHPGSPAARSWRRHRRILVIAGPPLIVLAIWVVLFAVYWNGSSPPTPSATPPTPPPDLNPAHVPILSVQGVLTPSGTDPGMVAFTGSGDLCPQCPVVPGTAANLNPPQVRFAFYFNLSDTGGSAANVSAFGITVTGGSGTDPFSLYGVLCCSPGFDETTEALFMTAGQTIGFEAIVVAPSIPSDAGTGYHITFDATYSAA